MHLEEHLKNKKADSQDILGALDAVMKAYPNLKPNLVKDAKTGVESEDVKGFPDQQAALQKRVEKALLKALELVKVKGTSETNERDDVNIKAASLLSQVRDDADVRRGIVDDLKMFLDKGVAQQAKQYKYKVPTGLYDEAFKTLATLSTKKNGGFAYFIKEWISNDNGGDKPEMIRAAHDSMLLMKNVPGEIRYEFVKEMVTLYSGVEHTAESYKPGAQTQSGAKVQNPKIFWDKIKGSVIKALQYMALEPKAADGGLIASVGKFFEWFNENKNKNKAPWVDPEIVNQNTPPPK
jgi:hypothetical protein